MPAYAMKGTQLSTRNYKHRHEFNGIFGKRFILGLEEYHASTKVERADVVMMWKDKGFERQVIKRGEVKEDEFKCPLQACKLATSHMHIENEGVDYCTL